MHQPALAMSPRRCKTPSLPLYAFWKTKDFYSQHFKIVSRLSGTSTALTTYPCSAVTRNPTHHSLVVHQERCHPTDEVLSQYYKLSEKAEMLHVFVLVVIYCFFLIAEF
jgi:hypothetical protein